FRERPHGRLSLRGDVDVQQLASPMHAVTSSPTPALRRMRGGTLVLFSALTGRGCQITRSLPPSTGTWAPVVLENAGPQSSAASSATSRLVTSVFRTLFFLYCSTLIP